MRRASGSGWMEAAHRRIPCPAAALFSSPSPLFLPLSQLELQLGGVPAREYTHAISCARRSLSLPARAQLPFPLHLSLLRRPSDALATTCCARRRHRQEGRGVRDAPIGSSQRRLGDTVKIMVIS